MATNITESQQGESSHQIRVSVYVEDGHGTRFGPIYFTVKLQMTVTGLKKLVADKLHIPIASQSWIINKSVVSGESDLGYVPDLTLADCGVNSDNRVLYCYTSNAKLKPRNVVSSEAASSEEGGSAQPGWACPQCTFLNEPTRPGCAMCTADRPGDYQPPPHHTPSADEQVRLDAEMSQELTMQDLEEKKTHDALQNYMALMSTDDKKVIGNENEFTCQICFNTIAAGEGVTLQECLHNFCRVCMTELVKTCTEAAVKCPFRNGYVCAQALLDREIKELVGDAEYERYLNRRLAIGEASTPDSFHCKTPDCKGWCVYEDDENQFQCDVCRRTNCLACKVQHEGVDCRQYQWGVRQRAQNDVAARQTWDAVQGLLLRGEAMTCPQCTIIIQKNGGCDHLTCSYCGTHLSWAKRARR